MELLQLINQLEAILDDGRRVPFSDRLAVDEEACRRVIDQMRVSVPDMIRQAERTLGERDRIIAQANEEASRIIGIARKQATDMVESHQLSLSAQRRADEIIVEAERESATMRAEADGYALKALQDLAQQLERIHREVENGISALAAAKSARTK